MTGATGFIGTRLVARLLADGHRVVALARRPSPHLPPGARFQAGDLLQPDPWRDAGAGCDRLYHLAALITFDPRRRAELMRQNGDGTRLALDAARRWNVAAAVVVSSACTLGLARRPDETLDEEDTAPPALAAANPYLAGKLAAEQAARERAGAQRIVIVNPTTVFGPGDRSLNSGTLVARVTRSPVVPVPPGGSNVVDVDDVVDGILAAAERGVAGRRYALGGENLRFSEIVRTIAEVTGRRPLRVRLPRWTRAPLAAAAAAAMRVAGGRFLTPQIVGDMFAFKYYSSARAARELGWRPRFRFRESVARAWDFYRQEGILT